MAVMVIVGYIITCCCKMSSKSISKEFENPTSKEEESLAILHSATPDGSQRSCTKGNLIHLSGLST